MSRHAAPRVIVVEDDGLMAVGICEVLGQHGFEVVGSYPQAELARKHAPWETLDAVATNYQLGGEERGDALLAWVEEAHPYVRRVLMTNFSNGHLPLEAARNADIVVRKPFPSRLLVEALCPLRQHHRRDVTLDDGVERRLNVASGR